MLQQKWQQRRESLPCLTKILPWLGRILKCWSRYSFACEVQLYNQSTVPLQTIYRDRVPLKLFMCLWLFLPRWNFYALWVNQMAHHEEAPPWCLCHCLGDKTRQSRVKQVAHPHSTPPIRWQRTPADGAGPNSATHHMLHEPRCMTLVAFSHNTPSFCISSLLIWNLFTIFDHNSLLSLIFFTPSQSSTTLNILPHSSLLIECCWQFELLVSVCN